MYVHGIRDILIPEGYLYAVPERKVYKMSLVLSNRKVKDSSAKVIFGDPTLCAQFLKGYVDIPLLKNVRPEDIEDVSERYVHMFTEERGSDVVKRVHIQQKESPFYLVSLIEHKSNVDYNVAMQVFRYMTFIWEDYEKEMEKLQAGISKTRDFKYPPILPIVFYDGMDNWTAATRLQDRIMLDGIPPQYVPDYQCILVQLKDYSNAELMKMKDELSIIMMLNKVQEAADFTEVSEEIRPEYVSGITAKSPKYLLDIMAHVTEVLLSRLNVPPEEVVTFTEQIKERHMGELFANFKGYDVQEMRKKLRKELREELQGEVREEVRGEVREEVRGEVREEVRGEVREEVREENMIKLINVDIKHGCSRENIIEDLMEQYTLSYEEAQKSVDCYWKA